MNYLLAHRTRKAVRKVRRIIRERREELRTAKRWLKSHPKSRRSQMVRELEATVQKVRAKYEELFGPCEPEAS